VALSSGSVLISFACRYLSPPGVLTSAHLLLLDRKYNMYLVYKKHNIK
jgi:hypothetical protein